MRGHVLSVATGAFRFNNPLAIRLLLSILPLTAFGAHYDGHKVDGMQYRAFARSLDTGRYYAARVVFDRKRALVQLSSGKTLVAKLEDENIDDPEEVIATDHQGSLWALSIDGLGEQLEDITSNELKRAPLIKAGVIGPAQLSHQARLTTAQPGNQSAASLEFL